MNYKIETGAGDSFQNVAKEAKRIATERNVTVEFDFNERVCLVNKGTNLHSLWRDYTNSWTMGWTTIGPDCVPEYDQKTQSELERLTKISDEKKEVQRIAYEAKEKAERAFFEESVKGIEMQFKDKSSWDKGLAVNTDPYGRCIYDYSEAWAKSMQREIANGRTVSDCADETSNALGFFGITGFMYGAAVATLSACWEHGEELRKWHNKSYNHEGDGVVNPAVISISI